MFHIVRSWTVGNYFPDREFFRGAKVQKKKLEEPEAGYV
jgi:hypothetical protein